MKRYFNAFMGNISKEFLRTHTQALMDKEFPQTTPATHEAADYIYNLLKENGFETERLDFIADGKTAYQDKIMPMCWDATYGKLQVMSDWKGDRVIADYERHPFSLIRFSVATPKEGLTARLVTWEQMQKGVDVKGAFVTVPQGMLPTDKALVPMLNAGAIGLVNGTVWGPDRNPDEILWANNCTETNSWNVNADERPFVGFCVTPRILEKLEKAANDGEVIVRAETDAHRYVGKMPAITALLKGASEREFWIIAHTAEPLEDDNSAGVISCIHSIISIRQAIEEGIIPPLKYSIRVLFAPELYGTVAFAEHFGGFLRERCIGAICVDGLPICSAHKQVVLQFAPSAIPFYGNILLDEVWNEYENKEGNDITVYAWGNYWLDDCFMSDPTVGLPTVMPLHPERYNWHCSCQKHDYIDYDKFTRVCAVYTAYMAMVTAYDSEVFEAFIPKAVSYVSNRLKEIAQTKPPRPETDEKERLMYFLKIGIANIRSFSEVGVSEKVIDDACRELEKIARKLTPIKSAEIDTETPVFDHARDFVPERTSVGIPHDFARVPLERRWHVVNNSLLSRVFSAMDGKKNLKTLITEAEWEEKSAWTEEEIEDFIRTLKFMDEFGYIKLRIRS